MEALKTKKVVKGPLIMTIDPVTGEPIGWRLRGWKLTKLEADYLSKRKEASHA